MGSATAHAALRMPSSWIALNAMGFVLMALLRIPAFARATAVSFALGAPATAVILLTSPQPPSPIACPGCRARLRGRPDRGTDDRSVRPPPPVESCGGDVERLQPTSLHLELRVERPVQIAAGATIRAPHLGAVAEVLARPHMVRRHRSVVWYPLWRPRTDSVKGRPQGQHETARPASKISCPPFAKEQARAWAVAPERE